ncbi:hypothetical protein [Allomesorhizobium camelthorni]|uniref:Uncharacterized protein n=1 Tax=Allomesorhizobium camelthorni TaxID=475069 RepID=A0A6G4WBI5_9HYPH|nr:hypothetical protein [Mesorhizobium camelthorni]NGO51969.1 hypothetical protein [Mesorhizobium camelthorni]
MRQFGKVDIPQAAFIEALKMGDSQRAARLLAPSWFDRLTMRATDRHR